MSLKSTSSKTDLQAKAYKESTAIKYENQQNIPNNFIIISIDKTSTSVWAKDTKMSKEHENNGQKKSTSPEMRRSSIRSKMTICRDQKQEQNNWNKGLDNKRAV